MNTHEQLQVGNGDEPGSIDFEQLSREHESESGAGDETAGGEAHSTPEAPASTATGTTAAKADVKEVDVSTAAGVATPDGKHIIPPQELIQTRVKNAQLRETVDTLTNQLMETQQQLRAATEGGQASTGREQAVSEAADKLMADVAAADGDAAQQLAILEAGLTEIEAESGWLGVAMRKVTAPQKAILARIAKLEATVGQSAKAQQDREAEVIAQVQRDVGEAIANTPVLAHWQAEGGEAWVEAQRIDEVLRSKQEWLDKGLTGRFAEVQRRVVAVLGVDAVPENLRQFIKQPDPGLSKDKVIAAGKAALDKTGAGMQTLSDIPGGTPAAASIATELDDDAVSVGRLAQHFQGKSVDELMGVFRT